MLEHYTATQFLAVLIGVYFLAAGTGLLTDHKAVSKMLKELIEQPLLGYLGGVIAFVIGGAIIAVHNNWSSLLSGLISLFGWISFAEGVLMLAFRNWFLGLWGRLASSFSPGFVRAAGIATMVAGVLLIWAGFD